MSEHTQPPLPSAPPFVRKVHQGLCTPRAFVRMVLDDYEHWDDYGISDHASDWADGEGREAPKNGILFGNWNDKDRYDAATKTRVTTSRLPSRFSRIAEYVGYDVEWSDEHSTCSDCGKAFRTSPDGYCWTPNYYVTDGEILCQSCALDDVEDYLAEFSGYSDRCIPEAMAQRIVFADYGYIRHNADAYESGWHPGQNDNPADVAKQLRAQGIKDFIFVQDEQSQFYVKFSVFVRIEEDEETDRETL